MGEIKKSDSRVVLMEASTRDLLKELESRGGHPGAVAQAVLLCMKKSEDYNHGKTQNPHDVDRSNYFPFGEISYAQMIHTKAQRFNSIVEKLLEGGECNFEGLHDTALDLINYAAFYIDFKGRKND